MKKTTIERIIENAYNNRQTVIGRYTYEVREDSNIYRTLTEDIGRSWIDPEGNQTDSWQLVASAIVPAM